MKYLTIIIFAFCIAFNAIAEDAKWTGKFEFLGEEKPNVGLWACEYKIKERKFFRIYEYYCPPYVGIYDFYYWDKKNGGSSEKSK